MASIVQETIIAGECLKANRRKSKSHSGRVFNFKLARFAVGQVVPWATRTAASRVENTLGREIASYSKKSFEWPMSWYWKNYLRTSYNDY